MQFIPPLDFLLGNCLLKRTNPHFYSIIAVMKFKKADWTQFLWNLAHQKNEKPRQYEILSQLQTSSSRIKKLSTKKTKSSRTLVCEDLSPFPNYSTPEDGSQIIYCNPIILTQMEKLTIKKKN